LRNRRLGAYAYSMSEPRPTADGPDSLEVEVTRPRAQRVEQATQIVHLLERIQELEARLAKDRQSASKPPSYRSPAGAS
jgi:hypothetical protein